MAEDTDDEYALVLSTGGTLFHYNSGTMTRPEPGLAEKQPSNFIEINLEDAADYQIEDGDAIRVSTRRGSVRAAAHVSDLPRKGVIWMPFHFAEEGANKLTIDAFDPMSKTGEYKVCASKIEKIPAEQAAPA